MNAIKDDTAKNATRRQAIPPVHGARSRATRPPTEPEEPAPKIRPFQPLLYALQAGADTLSAIYGRKAKA